MPARALRLACALTGIVLALVWLLSATAVIGGIPAWMPPAAVLALAVAVAIG